MRRLSLVAALAAAAMASAVTAQQGEQGRTWASIAKLPEWSGDWVLTDASFDQGVNAATNPHPNPHSAPLNKKWEDYRLSNAAANGGQGPASGTKNNASGCLPDGMPALMVAPHGFLFFYRPGLVSIVPENGEIRLIYTDGRAHPKDGDDSWEGHSIGHWENGTLVVDTVGIKPQAEVFMGMPNASNKTHVVERFHQVASDKIQVDTVVENPDQYTKPYTYSRILQHNDKGFVPYFCTENNRATAAGDVDLTPPKK